jgi:hypothetical protein
MSLEGCFAVKPTTAFHRYLHPLDIRFMPFLSCLLPDSNDLYTMRRPSIRGCNVRRPPLQPEVTPSIGLSMLCSETTPLTKDHSAGLKLVLQRDKPSLVG